MQFRNAKRRSSLPEIDLVPLLDVLMSVLTFFIALSLSLTEQIIADLNLPQVQNAERSGTATSKHQPQGAQSKLAASNTLEIAVDRQGKILIAERVINDPELDQVVLQHLTRYPQASLIVKADRALPYGQVTQLLKRLQAIGGTQIALAFTGG